MASISAHIVWPALVVVLLAPLALGGCGVPSLSLKRDTPAPLIVAPLREPAEAVPPDGMVTVRHGDTIYALAACHGVPPTRSFPITDWSALYRLWRPEAAYHTATDPCRGP